MMGGCGLDQSLRIGTSGEKCKKKTFRLSNMLRLFSSPSLSLSLLFLKEDSTL
jgi:hypothetical protein